MQKYVVRNEQVSDLCVKCYEDNVSGKLTDSLFLQFSQKYEAEKLELKAKIADYRKRLNEVDDIRLSKDRFIAAVKQFMAMDYL